MQPGDSTKVVILTKSFRVEGEISLYAGGRLTDYMNKADHFIAVTGARVLTFDGDELAKSAFLNLNRDRVEVIMPADEDKD
ncbi:MAG: hypothetical protein ABFS19_03545 [Thermodesulfobacteriota bacterium]